jgi:hypothetical protein
LIDEARSQGKPLRIHQTLRRHLGMAVKDPVEVFIEVLDRPAAQLMEEPPHFDPAIGVGIRSLLRDHQDSLALVTGRLHVGTVQPQ